VNNHLRAIVWGKKRQKGGKKQKNVDENAMSNPTE